MSHTIDVTFTPSNNSNAPGIWTFSPNARVSLDYGASSVDIYFNLSAPSGWDYSAVLLRRISVDPSSMGVTSATGFLNVTGTSAKQSYDWGSLEVSKFEDDQIKLEVGNGNQSSDVVVLGVELVVSSGGRTETSPDPQIILEKGDG